MSQVVLSGSYSGLGAAQVLAGLIRAVRPRQWLKNGLLFVPLAFSLNLAESQLVIRAAIAFAAFCAVSSAGYLLNDVADIRADREHPLKRRRPVASGLVPVPLALGVGAGLGIFGLGLATALSLQVGVAAASYLALTAAYTMWLKRVVLLDVFGISVLFVLRAAAGAVAIGVPISPWLYTATMLGALLIALGKRRAELVALGDDARDHRANLEHYSVELVDQVVSIISGAAVMTYALYTFSAENLPKDHSMMLTLPVVLYGLFRYLLVTRASSVGGAPEDLLFRDKSLLAAVGVWAAMSVGILYLAAH
ncbi:MAG: decaprenyl-phosphate phosphoribosyltransferase [Chloroflexi bacterium]|nr:decaprenyl-phosphate phosphoribosyltransferase [Chloroflexota bacterium]MBV9895122.1 decaprenyl-phosphate phosphoribosyltransferase [Chloroflexota bacterium]